MPRTLLAILILLVASLGLVSGASAKISKKQKEELAGHVAKLADSQDAETIQATLYVRGAIADRKEAKELRALEADDDARTRLAAKVAAVFAGDRKAPARVAEEIRKQGGASGLLSTMVAPLPDGDEKKVIEALLDGAKPGVQSDVHRYLARQRGPLFELLTKRLESSDAKTRSSAASAIVAAGRTDVLGTTERLLKAKDTGVRTEAIQLVIVFSEYPSAVVDAKKQLSIATNDSAADIRELAARRLLELKDAGAAKVLVALARESDGGAASLLGFLVEHDASLSPSAAEEWLSSSDAGEKLRAHQLVAASNDGDFIGKLVEMYGSTEFDDRLLAVKSIGHSDDERAANVLTRSLFEARDDIRMAAAEGLRTYASSATLPALKRALSGERNKEIKLVVIDAIGAVGGDDALQLLRFQVTNNDLDIKKRTVEAIRATGAKKGARALDVLLRDRNTAVQWRAFLAALTLDESVARPMFASVFRNPPDGFLADVDELDAALRKRVYSYLLTETTGTMRNRAAAIAMRRGEFDDVLYELATSSTADSSLRRDIVQHLGTRASRKDLLVLERVARGKDPGLAHRAAWMLTRHPSEALEPTYRGFLASKDDTLRAIAALGLVTVWQ